MKMSLTRRTALAGAVPAIAAVALPAAAGAAILADSRRPDAALLAMELRLRALYANWEAALHDYSVAEEKFFAEKPEQPKHPSLDGDADEFDAWEAKVLAVATKHGVDTFGKRSFRSGEDFMAIFRQVAETPARTPVGTALKVRWARYEDDSEMRDSIYRDVLAMAAAEHTA